MSAIHAMATLAGGCFWCMQPLFDPVPGVLATRVGYTGGHVENPNYELVSSGTTDHVEAVQVLFEPERVTYGTLLALYWQHIDPTTSNRQFCDVGPQFCPSIFYHDEDQHRIAREMLDEVKDKYPDQVIVTRVRPAGPFYPAEPYHQDYYRRYPENYAAYLRDCGRSLLPGAVPAS
ncbi:peptide-methionine (S)-S-oxide reductase [Natronocella acetinitrilica]|jgi:peptide-methionine (S)-S-oxide reductase|uniref:Peptide methionine sulfoxide reductase MsrA n=1 Tax=Natronocella acetinitrilica TaxID=414046 RepID=A0AAE3KDM3_9GAMM|nr:peptide-methionine (S)-S-oxide reductase MsrA [Natronocella acetinitrilica]MCP1677014.1 peptide-methionine (S)-S-oxide reductase [Natronocella acetinitrilica]